MMEWFRWYRGTTEDGKFRMAARHANVTVCHAGHGDVTVCHAIGVWSVILEDASHPDHRGVCNKDEDYIAAILDLDHDVVQSIIEGMDRAGLVSVGMGSITVTNWNKRQYEVDIKDPTAAERQKRRREKLKSNADVTARHGNVTVTSLPDTDTDTDISTDVDIVKARQPKLGGKVGSGNSNRGSRLNVDWQPSEQDRIFCADLGINVTGTADQFRDYWTSQPGQKGVKTNWSATWRNWCRRSGGERQTFSQSSRSDRGGSGGLVDTINQLIAEGREG